MGSDVCAKIGTRDLSDREHRSPLGTLPGYEHGFYAISFSRPGDTSSQFSGYVNMKSAKSPGAAKHQKAVVPGSGFEPTAAGVMKRITSA